MQEYATTVKSADVGLPWETHFRAKKQFEATDLKRIFQFCLRLLGEFVKMDPPYNDSLKIILKHLLQISESVLTWGYISAMHILFYTFKKNIQYARDSKAIGLSALTHPLRRRLRVKFTGLPYYVECFSDDS